MATKFPTNLFDFDFIDEERTAAQNEAARNHFLEVMEIDRAERISRLEKMANRAFSEMRDDAGFRLLDEIDALKADADGATMAAEPVFLFENNLIFCPNIFGQIKNYC